jgi:hypothetical protein
VTAIPCMSPGRGEHPLPQWGLPLVAPSAARRRPGAAISNILVSFELLANFERFC